jgi:mRNA-degrading endonuclease RelE of RelBE toxin-antitoxin system
MPSVLETSIFTRRADALLSRDERLDLIERLAKNPLAGDLVPGLGGIRKLRFAPTGRGKRGAFRVIYYLLNDNFPILALLLYGKNEQTNPTTDQRKAMLAAVDALKATARPRA